MALFIKTNKDPEGVVVRVDAGFRAIDGAFYLLLHRLPPLYTKPPSFLVRLSSDRIEQRGGEDPRTYMKAYAIQGFTDGECKLLRDARPGGTVLPFLNFSYPNVIRVLGKKFQKLTDNELRPFLDGERYWKIIPPE